MEYFVKVYINSKDDLPKVGDILNYVEVKGDKIYHTLSVTNKENKEWWLYNVISYCIKKPVEIPEITDEGNLLFNEMGEFSVKTFTGATAKGHLRKLKEEADEAIEDPTDIKEYADCLMALFGAAYKAGFTYDSLIQAGKEKLEINKSRKWVKLENEIYQHIKE